LPAAAVFVAIAFFPAPARAQSEQQLGWQHYGNDLSNMRFQNVDQINPSNVASLQVVWVSGGEFKVRGQAVAYDAATGKEVWRFFTREATTWAGTSWKTGGASVWQTPSVDPDLGLLYINTGNAAPDVSCENRAGTNLYSASIVALELATGTVRWYFQEVHHDLWDDDAAQPTILFSLARNGQTFPALGHCGKNGNYYILDRRVYPSFP